MSKMFLWTRVLECFPNVKQKLFRWLYQYLARYTDEDWTFMNYGHCENGYPLELREEDKVNRLYINLYEKVTQGIDLVGKELLEIGCGRGGGINYLHDYRGPKKSCGIDLSMRAIRFCRARHDRRGLVFYPGDALDLAYADSTQDVIVNVESSHCYPSRKKFFQEVYRVLKPGGVFCYADLHESGEDVDIDNWLRDSGFKVVELEDITAGVIEALQIDSDHKSQMIDAKSPWYLKRAVKAFAGCIGTRTYRSFMLGARRYTRWHLVKA